MVAGAAGLIASIARSWALVVTKPAVTPDGVTECTATETVSVRSISLTVSVPAVDSAGVPSPAV